jgi:mRNA-degrading endonuclease toxin of MazEF toxin-antitoxin module
MKPRPVFAISRKFFNENTGFADVALITSTIDNEQLEVVLPRDMKTQAAVLLH